MARNILVLIATALVVIGFLLYFVFSGNEEVPVVDQTPTDVFSFESENVRLEDGTTSSLLEGTEGEVVVPSEMGSVPKIRKISAKEVSGFGLFEENGTTTIRFIDRETGNIFETNSKDLNSQRITNTTILRTIDSFWLDKENLVLQYINENGDIETFSAKINKDQESPNQKNLIGVFAEKNIESLSLFNRKIFALIKNEGSRGVVMSPDLKSKNTVLNTQLEDISVDWVTDTTVAIKTKPSNSSHGYLFYLNTSTGLLDSILRDIYGLSSNVSKNNKGVIYSKSENSGVSLWYIEKKGDSPKKVAKETLAEKCVWTQNREGAIYCAVPKNINLKGLPDEWYKGNVSFSDEIWFIDLESGESKLIVDMEKVAGERIDAVKLTLNQKDNYLSFENRNDMNLWGIDLSQKEI
jgi:hypothetical protein